MEQLRRIFNRLFNWLREYIRQILNVLSSSVVFWFTVATWTFLYWVVGSNYIFSSYVGPNIRETATGLLALLFIMLNVINHQRNAIIRISSAMPEPANADILLECTNMIKFTKRYGILAFASGLALVAVYLIPEELDTYLLNFDVIRYFLSYVLVLICVALVAPVEYAYRKTSEICLDFIITKI